VSRLRRVLAHPVARNAAALSWVQLATFVVPLVTLPYLGRTLGPEAFGLVVLGQGLSFLVTLVVDFGFQLSATREVAAAGDDRHRHAEVAAGVLAAKLGLAVAALAGTVLAAVALGKLGSHPALAAWAWVAGAAQGLAPVFYFLGVERMGVTAAVNLVSRVTAAALTFVVVQGPGDAVDVLALYAICSVVATVVVFVLAHREMPLRRPRVRAAAGELRRAWTLFAMQSTLALYTSANVVLLGFVATTTQVAHFGAAERIVRAGTALMGTVTTAAFPRLTALVTAGELTRARQAAFRLAAVAGAGALLVAGVLALLAGPLVRLVFGPGFGEAADVLRVLALILPLIAVTGVLGAGLLLSLRRDAVVLRIALTAGVVNVALGLALGSAHGPLGMAVSVVVAEVVALAGCVLALSPARGRARPRPSRPAARRG
jgi:polysaccharide transporter, PST family